MGSVCPKLVVRLDVSVDELPETFSDKQVKHYCYWNLLIKVFGATAVVVHDKCLRVCEVVDDPNR